MSYLLEMNRKWIWSMGFGLVLLMGGIGLFFAISNAEAAQESEGKLVTIHDKSHEKVVVSQKTTVGDVLKQANITLSAVDRVDPADTTEINTSNFHINIYRAQPVQVVDGNNKQTVMTPHTTDTEIAKAAQRPLYDEDIATLTQSDNILDSGGAGLTMTVDRATVFKFVLYGKLITSRTQADSVGKMLEDKGIRLAKNDKVSLPLNTSIKTGLKVEIWREGKQTINKDEKVAFPTQQIEDPTQPVGYRQIKTPGVLGSKNVTYEIVIRNGKEVSRKAIQQVVTLKPKQQVEIVGSKPSFSGDFAAALAKLRACEGGYSSWNPAGPYYGAYQFDQGTWAANAPSGAEYGNATPGEQDQAARNLYVKRGWSPWPHCGAGLPDSYR